MCTKNGRWEWNARENEDVQTKKENHVKEISIRTFGEKKKGEERERERERGRERGTEGSEFIIFPSFDRPF